MPTRILCGAVAATVAVGLILGCDAGEHLTPPDKMNHDRLQQQEKTPSTAPTEQFTGTLEGGIMAIGGETTGWRLIGEGESGQMDVDVAAVRADAERLSGQRVTINGTVVTRDYVERGKVPVLVARSIAVAPR